MIYSIQPTELVLHIFLVFQIASFFIRTLSPINAIILMSISLMIFKLGIIDDILFSEMVRMGWLGDMSNPQILKVYAILFLIPINVGMYFLSKKRAFSIMVGFTSAMAMVSLFIIHNGFIHNGLHHIFNEMKSDIVFALENKDNGRSIEYLVPRFKYLEFSGSERPNSDTFANVEGVTARGNQKLLESILKNMDYVKRYYEETKRTKPVWHAHEQLTTFSEAYLYGIRYTGDKFHIIVDTHTARETFYITQTLVSTFTLISTGAWLTILLLISFLHSNKRIRVMRMSYNAS